MSSESRFDSGGPGASEPHTDPTLRAITGQELPPLWEPRVPELDDRTLAELLAELDGDDEPRRCARRRAAAPLADTAAHPVEPARETPAMRETPAVRETPPVRKTPATRETPAMPGQPRRSPHAPPTQRLANPRRVGPPPSAQRRSDRAHPDVSAIGPVIHSSFGDFRPRVQPVHDEPGLTGLTRGSRGRLGSLVFTLTFVAIFLIIVIETLVSLLSAGVGP